MSRSDNNPMPLPQDPGIKGGDAGCTRCPVEAAGGGDLAGGSGSGVAAEFGSGLFDTSNFPPRWFCGTWSELQGWVHISADVVIWLAYVAIPAALLHYLRRRRDVPFPWLVALFAAFILLCGLTHLLEAAMFWWPAYRFMGLVKLVTAIVSATTAVVLVPLIPRALALKSPAQLEEEVRRRTDELRANEKALIAAREAAVAAAAAKSTFLANMSHEIRTPLAAILGFAELAQADPARAAESTTIIERNGQHLLQVVDDVLDAAKIDAGKLDVAVEPIDVRSLLVDVGAAMRAQAERKGIELRLECRDDVPQALLTDAVRVRQILFNLVGNALKFTDAGTVVVAVATGEGTVEFRIEDTGIGMTASDAARLFTAFEQVRSQRGGTGLGLTISKRLAGLLGGGLEIARTAPGVGTAMRFWLPLRAATAVGATVANAGVDRETLRGRRVLVVDDMPDNRLLARRALETAQAEVVEAADGRRGLDTLAGMMSEGRVPDALLVDLGMPIVNGHEFAQAARSAGYRGALIALTASASPEERERCLAEGFDDYCTKPIGQRALVGAVAARLTSPSPQTA
jgi:two-component system, sensor histidine kinase